MRTPTRERSEHERVVVTGLGSINPLALNVPDTWEGIRAGRSGIRPITRFDMSAYPTRIAGTIDHFNAQDYLDRKEARRMSRFSQVAVVAAAEALADARLELAQEDRETVGTLLGTAMGGMPEVEDAARTLVAKGGMRISPLHGIMVLPNLPAFQVAHAYDIRGYSGTVTTACASGTQAIGEAAEVIRRGQADVMITGASDVGLCELTIASYCVFKALSTRNDEPERASRPFDADRDGFVPGEGCGILILESLAHARARGARIYCEVLGYGTSNDGFHMIAPDPEGFGAARSMRAALAQAGIEPQAVDYINAHGTGTPLGDIAETVAVKLVFGEHAYRIPMSATKSMIGHLAGAAGAVEGIVTIKAMEQALLPPTINLETPDPECDLDYVPLVARPAQVDIAMSNNFGLGGQNASIIFGRYHGD